MKVTVERKVVFEWTDDDREEDMYEEFEVGDGISIDSSVRAYDGDIIEIGEEYITIHDVNTDEDIGIPYGNIEAVDTY